MFAPKISKPQTRSVSLAPPRSILTAQRHSPVEQALLLQRTIGNQATLRLLAQRARNLTGNVPHNHDEREAAENSIARAAPPGPSWDFSKIPIFAPDRANEPQAPSALAVRSLPSTIQPKLTVGPVDDPLEREADRVANHVMGLSAFGLSITAAPPKLSRKCAACEDEARTLRTKSDGSPEGAANEAPSLVHQALRSPGQPLDRATRQFFNSRFASFDFANVRIHADREAAVSAKAVNAAAYTVGDDIVFDTGKYAPGTVPGRLLLAHELTHVIQQDRNQMPDRGVLQRQDATPQGAAPQTTLQSDATAAAAGPDPVQLKACLAACAGGGEAIVAFCATLPDPRLKAACYALYFVGEVACDGWCYWQFGE